MSSEERAPSELELQAMAYADGELSAEARRAFELELDRRPELAREVAAHLRLAVLARQLGGGEPIDSEWRRLAKDPLQRAGASIGWFLALFGLLGTAGWIVWSVESGDLALWPKIAIGALVLGVALLLVVLIRARLRTLPFDPYRDVQR